ncbi:MAG TPA: aminotransferase class V-fold PLP-dependent enzyme [Chitinophagaceae bacterium]|nr:aminotransferase class V-fold PLP-dependent enzyme [Chitinophagaceae bacterium]
MKNKNSKPVIKEESLDPRDWDELKKLGNVMVNDMVYFLQTIREQPVWTKPPQSAKNSFKTPLPYSPMQLGDVYNEFKQNVLPYYLGNIHPRYWSWVMGAGTAQSMLAEMLAAGMNCNVGIGDQAPMYVDQQVIDWCRQMMSFPPESSGALVSSASVANLNALIVARNSVSTSIRSSGINGQKKMVIYASTETHSSIQKAAEIIGIGSDGVRKVKVNDKYEMDTVHLQELIEEDKKEGNIPFCIVANAGTVNTGAIDPLDKIFWICCKENLWMHVDGAFGALLKLLPEYDEQLDCLEFADSITFDLHKWMSIPYEAGVVLVKDADMHRKTFALQPDYISNNERGIAAGPELTSNFGFELSRNFKALKVWMSLKEHGIEKFARIIRQNITQAKYLTDLVEQSDELELTAPTATNIVCFRFNPGKNDLDLDKLNKEILMRLQESGIAAPSYTRLNGNYCMRVANVNHRTITNDFDVLVNEIIKIGNQVVKEEEVAVDC